MLFHDLVQSVTVQSSLKLGICGHLPQDLHAETDQCIGLAN